MSVAVYNLYMSTLGGGERSSLEFACALRDIAKANVYIYTLASSVTLGHYLERAFGLDLTDVSFVTASSKDGLLHKLHRGRHDIFVNHTFGSNLANPSAIGIYAMMFPHAGERGEHFLSYDHVLCNSEFTAMYTRMYLPGLGQRIGTLYPPIAFRETSPVEPKDWRMATNIGRYSFAGHCKKQYDVACAVKRANDQLGQPLRLLCFGRITEKAYFEHCRAISSEAISFYANASEKEIADALCRAGFYVHGCGLGLRYGDNPEKCEHLGLSILEAMHAGCIPFVVSRGGAPEYIEHGVNGFLYEDAAELVEVLNMIASAPDIAKQRMAEAARRTAQNFAPNVFRERLRDILTPGGNRLHGDGEASYV